MLGGVCMLVAALCVHALCATSATATVPVRAVMNAATRTRR